MRDILAHGYFGLDAQVVWSTATTQVDEAVAFSKPTPGDPDLKKAEEHRVGLRLTQLAGADYGLCSPLSPAPKVDTSGTPIGPTGM
jgi:hypothetical protein